MKQFRSIFRKTKSSEKIITLVFIAYTATSSMAALAEESSFTSKIRSTFDNTIGYVTHSSPAHFNDNNELLQPEGYRGWVHIGTQVTPNDMNNGKAIVPEFHNVYIDHKSFNHWKKTGEFRDGTMIVKELMSVGDKKALTGNGYFMGEFTGLEAAVKDSKRFPKEPGNWAYFMYGMKYPLPDKTAAKPTSECNSCHEKNAKDDWVFTQYYPNLRTTKPQQSTPSAK